MCWWALKSTPSAERRRAPNLTSGWSQRGVRRRAARACANTTAGCAARARRRAGAPRRESREQRPRIVEPRGPGRAGARAEHAASARSGQRQAPRRDARRSPRTAPRGARGRCAERACRRRPRQSPGRPRSSAAASPGSTISAASGEQRMGGVTGGSVEQQHHRQHPPQARPGSREQRRARGAAPSRGWSADRRSPVARWRSAAGSPSRLAGRNDDPLCYRRPAWPATRDRAVRATDEARAAPSVTPAGAALGSCRLAAFSCWPLVRGDAAARRRVERAAHPTGAHRAHGPRTRARRRGSRGRARRRPRSSTSSVRELAPRGGPTHADARAATKRQPHAGAAPPCDGVDRRRGPERASASSRRPAPIRRRPASSCRTTTSCPPATCVTIRRPTTASSCRRS